jgi:outer membrane protein TolC
MEALTRQLDIEMNHRRKKKIRSGVWKGVCVHRFLFFILIFLSFCEVPQISIALDLPENESKRLTLREAIDFALHQNPNIKLSLKTYESSYAKIGEVQSGFYPQLETDLSYTRATGNFAPQPGLVLPGSNAGAENDTTYPNYNATLSFKQLLFDFGKLSSQVRSTEMLARSSNLDMKTTTDTLILNVRQSYYGLLQNLQIQKVSEETVRQMEKHLEQAEGFFKAGSKPKFDVTKARVDLTNAKLNLIKAKNDVQIARVTLNNAMGVQIDFQVNPVDQLAYTKEEITLEKVQQFALENRPELASVRLKKQSGLYNLEYSKRQYYPTLSANGNYVYRNQDFPLVYNWNIGATLAFPFFSGFQTKKQIDEAQAIVEVFSAQEEIQIQNILLELRQAYLNLTAAEEQITTSELIVKQADENLDLAEGRYKAGVGTAIETTDAEVSLSNAKTSAVQALYNYNVAQAQLEKAMSKEIQHGTGHE